MTSKVISILAVILLVLCLLSGGCSSIAPEQNLKAWKDLIKLAPEDNTKKEVKKNPEELIPAREKSESISIKLYFAQADKEELVMERREITRTEGIARSTMQELLKGSDNPAYRNVFPEGTRLLDINLKPDGTCILDFSSELRRLENGTEEKQMIDAVCQTLAQFPAVKQLVFMIDGREIDIIKGEVDFSSPIKVSQ
ncbi:GerMN domain-containing protein [Syntrophomonas wolfei]|jgi:spore germination protein GerM|uniref:GerMN domain-containing protein n=1 Tax=Syntrophomonas wolfei TaxID=863 RepID=UPI000773AF6A|nr:GerMN domain-containing protein [Syntrophomonas wolfei]